ncbi:hypothetical protein LJR225_002910 [Phenylobacterium sp. LjRoot225]
MNDSSAAYSEFGKFCAIARDVRRRPHKVVISHDVWLARPC